MSDKPSYLGLLNAIAIAEGHAHAYLSAWAETTPSADVRGVLLKIAAREGEHASSFSRRINELGYEVRRKPDADSPDGDRAIAGHLRLLRPREDGSAQAPPPRHR